MNSNHVVRQSILLPLFSLKTQITLDKNIFGAIAMALYEYQGNNVHDKESGIITIQRRNTLWNAKFLGVTPKP